MDKTLAAVHERLTKEIDYWSDRFIKLTDDKNAGKDVRLNLENVRRTLSDLEARLESRKKELQSMRHVTSATPVALSGALVIPAGLLRTLRGEPAAAGSAFSTDPEARSRIEQIAMKAVRQAEEARGCRVVDVSAQKCGWDITAYAPIVDGRLPEARHIEVKGRVKGATTVTVTKNEIFESWNQGNKYHLAIVLVGEDDTVEGLHYVPHPFKEEPGWGVASVNYDLKALLERAEKFNQCLIPLNRRASSSRSHCRWMRSMRHARERNPSGMGIRHAPSVVGATSAGGGTGGHLCSARQ